MLALCAKAAHEASPGRRSGVGGRDVAPGRLGELPLRSRPRSGAVGHRGPQAGPHGSAWSTSSSSQADRVAVRAAVTVGVPRNSTSNRCWSVNPVVAAMSPEPPPDIAPIGPGHPMAEINHLAAGCDIRPDMSSLWSARGRPVAADTRIWVRPRGEPPDALFALTLGDISMPVTFAVGRTGWAPTVQLTAYLRGVPADGWLRVRLHHHPDRSGLVRRGSHRRRQRRPDRGADPSARLVAAAVMRCRQPLVFPHGQNRDHRRRQYGRGAVVGTASGGPPGQGHGGRRTDARACPAISRRPTRCW